MITGGTIKNNAKFHCFVCDYHCCKKSDFDKHLKTKKHISASSGKTKSPQQFKCDKCGIIYKYQSGLCRHRKVCTQVNQNNTESTPSTQLSTIDFKELFRIQQQEIGKLRQMILDQQEEQTRTISQILEKLETLSK